MDLQPTPAIGPVKQFKATCSVVMLGCPKNLVDTERMLGLLYSAGYKPVPHPEGADLVVLSTCAFLASARQEAYQVIEEMLEHKRRGQIRAVMVVGCLPQWEKEVLLARYPEVDQFLGVFARDEIVEAADRILAGQSQPQLRLAPPPAQAAQELGRVRITLPHVGYLKIAEGCNRRCSFCLIPQIRGPYRSKTIDQILQEAQELAADGVQELILIAQDTSAYGRDLAQGHSLLPELLRQLDQLEAIRWIRLMYLYPVGIDQELIQTIASARKILPYLDLPLQHISDPILQRMNRLVDRRQTEQLLERLRQEIPRLVIRTTLMVGFPGETEAHFQELIHFVQHQRFERLGVFAFSPEPGTSAAQMPQQIPEPVRQTRRQRLLQVQQKIAFAYNEAQVGKVLQVLIDQQVPGQAHAWIGRTYADAPEIDGVVYVTGQNLRPGQIVPCEIVAAQGYDLIGVAIEETEDLIPPNRGRKNHLKFPT
ncbi:MAG: 30S ribosomal protein S12 methylthiotransferase RimO [Thermoguttaceae bacterium]|nr:30S ribosomal protein S12 methylthiotransferase RimO [Thermoguttaceae bacterium]